MKTLKKIELMVTTLLVFATCGGGADAGQTSETSKGPLPVQPTSYLNAKTLGFGNAPLPEGATVSGVAHAFADFNQDDHPDVFVACHGLDVDPFPGEKSALILSKSDGTYAKSFMDDVAYNHGAAAGDLRRTDLLPAEANEGVVLDMVFHNNHIYMLRTSGGDGTFYERAVIQKVAYPSLESSVIYHSNRVPFVVRNHWSKWIPRMLLVDGKLVSTANQFSSVSVTS